MGTGAFRAELKDPIFTRGFKPRYSHKIETVADIQGGRVIASSGNKFPLKYVMPVSATSTPATAQAPVQGSAQHSERARRELLPFANRVQAAYTGQTVSLHALGRYLRDVRGFEAATMRAKIRQRKRIVSFLRQYPELFTVTSTLGTGTVNVV